MEAEMIKNPEFEQELVNTFWEFGNLFAKTL
jgi:hypothetical protein